VHGDEAEEAMKVAAFYLVERLVTVSYGFGCIYEDVQRQRRGSHSWWLSVVVGCTTCVKH
jgi:hypothetical protein